MPIPGEVWKDVPGYEGLYQASNMGRVRSIDRRVPSRDGKVKHLKGRILRPGWREGVSTGSMAVVLSKKSVVTSKSVHVLVLETFVGPRPPGMEACHFPDRSHRNNKLDNLRWDTVQANRDDMVFHGTRGIVGDTKGELNGRALLTADMVLEIRRRYAAGGCSHLSLARAYKVCESTVCKVINGDTWRSVTDVSKQDISVSTEV